MAIRKDEVMAVRSAGIVIQGDTGDRPRGRGRYLTLQQAADAYPAFSLRLLRRLAQERRIAFSRAGRCIVLAEADIEGYLDHNRVEPARWRSG